MIVSELITEIRYELGDNSANNWSDNELLAYINEAYRYFYNVASMISPQTISKTVNLVLTTGTSSISLPSDYWGLVSLIIPEVSSSPLLAVNQTDMEYPQNTGYPTQYYIDSTNINFNAIADKDYNVVFNYIPDVSVLSLSDTIPIKSVYLSFLKFYVLIRVWNRNEATVNVERIFFMNYGRMLINALNVQAHSNYEVTEDLRDILNRIPPQSTIQQQGG